MTADKSSLLGTLLKPSRWLERGAMASRRQVREAARRRQWREFTLQLGAAFARQGYAVRQLDDGEGRPGRELLLHRDGGHYIVECEHWRRSALSEELVREVVGRMLTLRCNGAFLVTSGYFTADAVSYAAGRNVVLVEGPQLRDLLRDARQLFTE